MGHMMSDYERGKTKMLSWCLRAFVRSYIVRRTALVKISKKILGMIFAVLLGYAGVVCAESIHLAVASNFADAIVSLVEPFEALTIIPWY